MNTNAIEQSSDLFGAVMIAEETQPGKITGEREILNLFGPPDLAARERFELKNEGFLLQLAHANNKILSLSNSRTRILAHQVESTHRIVNALHQRFMLADEVGLGKTVEAGLVIKELMYRYNHKRILIACPASLLMQWQCEMDEKFGERFEVLDRRMLEKKRREIGPDSNPWMHLDRVICSLDFIKNAAFTEDLTNTTWDAVIFDEAHRLRRDGATSTLTYNVAELISERTKALLLLTATPFRGKLEELYFLIRLADKNLLGPFQTFYNEYCLPDSDLSPLREKLSSIVIRRTKKEIGGFTSRHARTIRFDLFPEERELYEATTRYVAEEFNRAMQSENRAVGFVMTVFQKLLDSSSFALLCALRNRRAHLGRMLERAGSMLDAITAAESELPELPEDEMLEDGTPEDFASASTARTVRELEEEIATLDRLIELASRIERNKKGEKLKSLIKGLKKQGYVKFLIFTQFRTTQDYLQQLLQGYDVAVFNGSMDRDSKEEAIESFKHRTEVLICTEAGGEGRNMQFCSILINYDLPWSPLKIEQRIGRLHRFGQKEDVHIFNFSTRDTVAERVLDVLTRKLRLFEESIGTPDIMLGEIEDDLKLNRLFMELAAGRRGTNEVMSDIDESLELARRSYEKLSDLAVTRKLDFNYDEYYRITRKDRRFSNRQLQSFICRYRECEPQRCRLEEHDPVQELFMLSQISPETGEEENRLATFDSEKALSGGRLEFLAFGHWLIDSSIAHSHTPDFGGQHGITFVPHIRPFTGAVFTFIVTYRSITETRECIPVIVTPDNLFPEHEIEEIERCVFLRRARNTRESISSTEMENVYLKREELYAQARERLLRKIEEKVWDLRENLDLVIDPEIEKINTSYSLRIKELQEQLERQENTQRLLDKDMKSAIGRTRNLLLQTRREMDNLLSRYRRYLGIEYSIELLSGGYVAGVDGISLP